MYFCMQTSFAFAYTITQQAQTVIMSPTFFILLCVFLQKCLSDCIKTYLLVPDSLYHITKYASRGKRVIGGKSFLFLEWRNVCFICGLLILKITLKTVFGKTVAHALIFKRCDFSIKWRWKMKCGGGCILPHDADQYFIWRKQLRQTVRHGQGIMAATGQYQVSHQCSSLQDPISVKHGLSGLTRHFCYGCRSDLWVVGSARTALCECRICVLEIRQIDINVALKQPQCLNGFISAGVPDNGDMQPMFDVIQDTENLRYKHGCCHQLQIMYARICQTQKNIPKRVVVHLRPCGIT